MEKQNFMPKYLIQFQQGEFNGTREIEAENEEEAIKKMWEDLMFIFPPQPGVIRAQEILEIQIDE